MPERPSMSPCQVGSLPTPSGEIMPIPVTTTRRLVMRVCVCAGGAGGVNAIPRNGTDRRSVPGWARLRSLGALVDVLDRVLNLLDLLGLVVRNLDAELL